MGEKDAKGLLVGLELFEGSWGKADSRREFREDFRAMAGWFVR